jgi:hypothetical protein
MRQGITVPRPRSHNRSIGFILLVSPLSARSSTARAIRIYPFRVNPATSLTDLWNSMTKPSRDSGGEFEDISMGPVVHSQRGTSARDVSSYSLRARARWCAGTLDRPRDRERCGGRRGAPWFQAFQALAEVRLNRFVLEHRSRRRAAFRTIAATPFSMKRAGGCYGS